jgi:hypothetical protein
LAHSAKPAQATTPGPGFHLVLLRQIAGRRMSSMRRTDCGMPGCGRIIWHNSSYDVVFDPGSHKLEACPSMKGRTE